MRTTHAPHDPDAEPRREHAHRPAPAPSVRIGTRAWASAIGNQAVARLARQTADPPSAAREEPGEEVAVEPPSEEPLADVGAAAEPTGDTAQPAPDDAEAAPETSEAALEDMPDDQLPA